MQRAGNRGTHRPTQCVIEEGTDGLLATPKNACDIARAILELLGDADQRASKGRRGHAKTVAKFTVIAGKRAVTGEAYKGAGKTA